MEKFVVAVDADLSDLIPGFLANKRKDAETIVTAARAGDHAALRAIGHKIKGEGGSYGLDRISEIGAQLERAAIAGDPIATRNCGESLQRFLDALEVVYE